MTLSSASSLLIYPIIPPTDYDTKKHDRIYVVFGVKQNRARVSFGSLLKSQSIPLFKMADEALRVECYFTSKSQLDSTSGIKTRIERTSPCNYVQLDMLRLRMGHHVSTNNASYVLARKPKVALNIYHHKKKS